MKNLLLVTTVLFASSLAHAEKKSILCEPNPNRAFDERLHLELDNSGIDPSSGFFSIEHALWAYQYSGARLQCTGGYIRLTGIENFRCIGFANDAWGIELTVSLKNGKGTAKIHHLDPNVYAGNEGKVIECQIEKKSQDL